MDFYFVFSRQLLQGGGSQGCLNLWEQQRRRVSGRLLCHIERLVEVEVWMYELDTPPCWVELVGGFKFVF